MEFLIGLLNSYVFITMAYIPELLATEEVLASAYDLSTGKSVFVSTDLSDYSKINLQFSYTNVNGENVFVVEQSNDNISWIAISEQYDFINGSGTFAIDKSQFTSKYVRVDLTTATAGALTINLIAKR